MNQSFWGMISMRPSTPHKSAVVCAARTRFRKCWERRSTFGKRRATYMLTQKHVSSRGGDQTKGRNSLTEVHDVYTHIQCFSECFNGYCLFYLLFIGSGSIWLYWTLCRLLVFVEHLVTSCAAIFLILKLRMRPRPHRADWTWIHSLLWPGSFLARFFASV